MSHFNRFIHPEPSGAFPSRTEVFALGFTAVTRFPPSRLTNPVGLTSRYFLDK